MTFRLVGAQAAGQAALRREQDNVWCPCETHKAELHGPIHDLEVGDWDLVPEDSTGACPMLYSPHKPSTARQHDERHPDPASCQHSDGSKRAEVTVCDLTMDSDSETSSSPGTFPEACETGSLQVLASGAGTKHKRRLSWWSKKTPASPKKNPPESPAAPTNSITSLERPSKRLQVGADPALNAMDVSPKGPTPLCACPSSPDHLRDLATDDVAAGAALQGWGHGRSTSAGSLPDACSDDASCAVSASSSLQAPPSRSASFAGHVVSDDSTDWPAALDKGKSKAPGLVTPPAKQCGGLDDEEVDPEWNHEWAPIPGNPICTREVGEPSGLSWCGPSGSLHLCIHRSDKGGRHTHLSFFLPCVGARACCGAAGGCVLIRVDPRTDSLSFAVWCTCVLGCCWSGSLSLPCALMR